MPIVQIDLLEGRTYEQKRLWLKKLRKFSWKQQKQSGKVFQLLFEICREKIMLMPVSSRVRRNKQASY